MELGDRVRIVLVQPMYSGNVGSVARLMKNFGFRDLVLVSPSAKIDDAARMYAVKAQDLLEGARIVDSVEEAVKGADIVVGTTARSARSPSNVLRGAYSPREVAQIANRTSARFAFLFGREDSGLRNEELELCDVVLRIPSSRAYPTLNVASAAAIVMYELFSASRPAFRLRAAGAAEVSRISGEADKLLEAVGCPLYRRRRAVRALRNVLGRATPTAREASLLVGIFRKSRARLEASPASGSSA
ncbi:MAG: RNA methyltransferase [Candidatus Brockarchaeota archaeon]|nr:RNA methyltransferase [Candidatus Brockarchaeota archaeon]